MTEEPTIDLKIQGGHVTKEEHNKLVTDLLFKGHFAGQYFNKEGKFQPALLSIDIQKMFYIVTMKDNREIWIYNPEKGYYEPNGAETLRAIIKKILGIEYREKHAKATIDDITASTYIERKDFTLPDHLVPVKNGILDLRENPPKLLPHNPEYFITGVLPAHYNPSAKCPNFQKFLEEILPEIIPRLQIQEGFGNCLTPSHEYMMIFFFYGEGYNGKSTLLNVLKALLGEKNVSNASLAQIAYGRWFIAELYRKSANIYADVGLKELKHTGGIKILTGEDTTYGERKFRNPFPFMNTAKPWFSGNAVPYVYDDSNAFFRRWVIIIFQQKFPKGALQTDPQMIQKLTTPEELSGILNWALEGYYRLRKQKTFSALKTVEERRKQWKELSDPFSVFLANCVVAGEWVTKEDFYLSFREYCIKKGFRVISKSLVGRKMKELGYMEGSMRKEEKGKQHPSWLGIEVKSEFFVEEEDKEEPKREGLDEVWEREMEKGR